MNCILAGLFCFAAVTVSASEYTVNVQGGGEPLRNAVVTVRVPDESFPQSGTLQGHAERTPFQRTKTGEFTFVLPELKAGATKLFSVVAAAGDSGVADGALATLEAGKIKLSVLDTKVLVYQGHESELPRPEIKPLFKRGGYIHPVYSPSGKVITDDYPPNHIHHHGIWFPWTKTSFEGRSPDFWNMGEGKGKIEFVKFGEHWSGPVHAGFQAEHRFIDLTSGEPKAVLNESWTVTTYNIPNAKYFAFDLVSTQSCTSNSRLTLPKYYYGGLGVRGNWAWNGEQMCSFLTSTGETDRKKGNETRGNWCHIGGEIEGQFTGMAVLSHPENFRSPQPLRLHPSEPFFCFAPSQVDDWAIEPGKPYVSRYRFIVSDGRPDKEVLAQIWAAYAHPPKVVVQKR